MHVDGLRWRPLSRREPTIEGLDLAIPPGQRVLLAGASGSGKSTVLRALAGLLDPEDGDGEGLVPAPSRPGERGLLLQNPVHALVGATVARDAAFGPENAGLPRPELTERAARALEAARVDLDPERVPLDASGGQQQRIALAGALALRPDLLLLDEPTSMLDAPTAEEVRRAILAVTGRRTLVVAEHRIGPWLPHVDRLIVLGSRARVLADGHPDQLLSHRREVLIEAGVLEEEAAAEEAPGPVGPSETVAALRGVTVPARGLTAPQDLELRAGRLTALTGPSGAGKTSLLRVLVGATEPGAGAVSRPEPSQIALVPQDPEHSFVATTVREEVLASPWATDEDLADELLQRAGLAPLAGAHPHRLSGGEQRRLAIVAALAQRPDLLVLDEPTVGLDARRRREVLELLR